MSDASSAWWLGAGRPTPPKPQPRAPLVLPPGDYAKTLPWTPPTSRDFLRADSWGVTLPGAPWVPGASSRHPERILSWFIDRYSPDWQARYLDAYAARGYTHLKLSYADSCGPVDNGPWSPPGNAQTLEQFVQTCLRVKDVVQFAQVVIGSKYFQPHDMSAQQWADFADPIMDALIAAKAVDEFILGWEWDLWNTPGRATIEAFKHAGQKAHAADCSFWMHFSPEKTSWFADGDKRGRYGFYDDIGTDVDGLNYQTVPTWDMAETQARIVDTLHQFGEQGNRHKFRFDEDQASLMFDNDQPDEDAANARGFAALCTIDNVKHTDAKVLGFGNGARMPDGTVI
jgi:hypothetical protein